MIEPNYPLNPNILYPASEYIGRSPTTLEIARDGAKKFAQVIKNGEI